MQNMDWLEEEVGEYEDDYLIVDCPGMSGIFIFSAVTDAARHAAASLDRR